MKGDMMDMVVAMTVAFFLVLATAIGVGVYAAIETDKEVAHDVKKV